MSISVSSKTKLTDGSSSVPPTNSTQNQAINIGRILLEMGKITPEDTKKVLQLQQQSDIRFGDAALQLGLITEADIQQVLARQFDHPYLLPEQGNYSPELLVAYQPFSVQVEEIRAVRGQLLQRWFSIERKALAVVSINPHSGASLFVANLAVLFSQLGERTLLIDANLRQPSQHKIFNLESKQGLSDVLAERAASIDVISKPESFVNLSVLSAGTVPPNPSELLSRTLFSKTNEKLVNQFDIVLYDTSAFLAGTDALATAIRAGGVLLVTHKNNTRLADVNAVSEQIIGSGVEIIGSVLIDF
jgi:chain length determinant protein tyrosine kinase EpsG